jgi:hypothetical protein
MIAASPEAVRAVLTDGAAAWSWRDSGAGGAGGQLPPGLFRGIKRRVETGR